MNLSIPLSKLVAGRQNPRRVQPERAAYRRLVASIRAHQLMEPLVVRPIGRGEYSVIAGKRRLAALRDVHRDSDPKIPCVVREVDDVEAASLSLAENFAREGLQPLDEAEAFARLASVECKGVAAIAAEFGVSTTYVRQRVKLASLTDRIKAALREGDITIGIAEAFAAVPQRQQEQLWREVNGKPASVQQVKGLIQHRWIDARHALFAVESVEPSAVSQDLFGGGTLIERSAFLKAQAAALQAEQAALTEDGWKEVVIADPQAVQDRLHAMESIEPKRSAADAARLAKLREGRAELEATPQGDEEAERQLAGQLAELDEQERRVTAASPGTFAEASKAAGTVFLVQCPDGRIERYYALSRQREQVAPDGTKADAGDSLPTSDDLSTRQRAELHSHEALAVREAVSKDKLVRKRLIVLALHDRIAPDALTVRREPARTPPPGAEPFTSPLADAQRARRREIDPLPGDGITEEVGAYKKIAKMSEKELDTLIAVLIVEAISGHAHRPTPLVSLLAEELGVSLRRSWTPDAKWLGGYQKAHLAHLCGLMRSGAGAAALSRKKSQLVDELAALFSQAASAEGGFEDKELAKRANAWLPSPDSDEGKAA